MKVIVVAAILLVTLSSAAAPRCHGTNNTVPLNEQDPVLIRSVPNGKLYLAGQGNDTFEVMHLWGTPYEMGYAQGQLRAEAFPKVWSHFTDYIESMINSKIHDLPQWLVDLFAQYGAPLLLQMSYANTKPFTPQRYLDEMQGIADGAGIDVKIIQNINMFPELTKAACTIVGANGVATPNGKIQHLRALDFSPHCPIKDYPQVTVYHGANGSATIANIGWAGLIGSLTGISDTSIGIGEKVWLRHTKGISGVHGEPWMFILRDVLMTANMDEALSTIVNANRTCAIHVGIGDSTTNTFRGVQMAKERAEIFNWSSVSPSFSDKQHPVIEDVMYWDKHEQPTFSYCLSDLLQMYHGQITAKDLALNIAPTSGTGNMHCVTFDYEAQLAFIANARKTNVTAGPLNAYERQFTQLNLTQLWMEPAN